jgi:ABC-type Fe3+/spermidine/putrescine transport system ATPase subunit
MTPILELRNLHKFYRGAAALRALSMRVNANEYISLLGPSGSGKSTLLRVIAGFEQPDGGDVLLEGRSVIAEPAHRRHVGFVFQNFALFPHISVFENVAFGLKHRERGERFDPVEIRRRVGAMLDLVGLGDLGGRDIAQISGGQKQRVALARSLVADPKIILLDEPLGALDANLRERMMVELRRIRRELGITFLHVTGNEQEALAMGDRVAVLDSGEVAQFSDPDTVYNRPASARVARFLNCYNIFDGEIEADRRFRSGAALLACPSGLGAFPGPASYCARSDTIRVFAIGDTLGADQAAVPARYVTSEYAGRTVTHFFRLADGKTIDVEYHSSLRRPEEFEVGREYALAWPAEQALVFRDGPAATLAAAE